MHLESKKYSEDGLSKKNKDEQDDTPFFVQEFRGSSFSE